MSASREDLQVQRYSDAARRARQYYNGDDAATFYSKIWGGEDIHVGIYRHPSQDIASASQRTVRSMVARAQSLDEDSPVLDLGSGFGGAARFIASEFGCPVTCLDISETQNAVNRGLTREAGLDHLVEIRSGSFEEIPFGAGSFELVWSQDALLHSGDRAAVVSEVSRVLRPKGEFLFTDIMQADGCPAGVLDPILERIRLESLASPGFYRTVATRYGLTVGGFTDLSENLAIHYGRVSEELSARLEEMREGCGTDYVDRMLVGLRRWVEAARAGHLCWGIFRFLKPAPAEASL